MYKWYVNGNKCVQRIRGKILKLLARKLMAIIQCVPKKMDFKREKIRYRNENTKAHLMLPVGLRGRSAYSFLMPLPPPPVSGERIKLIKICINYSQNWYNLIILTVPFVILLSFNCYSTIECTITEPLYLL